MADLQKNKELLKTNDNNQSTQLTSSPPNYNKRAQMKEKGEPLDGGRYQVVALITAADICYFGF